MQPSADVKAIIERINAGVINDVGKVLDNSDFGVFISAFEEDGEIKIMEPGYSQVEDNLSIIVKKSKDLEISNTEIVGWKGSVAGKDSKCRHDDHNSCSHCNGHKQACNHCNHPTGAINEAPAHTFDAPELNYDETVKQVTSLKYLLEPLAKEGLGLSLLHGHSSKFKFTKLPIGCLSVVSGGRTKFVPESELLDDTNFVPTCWRFCDGDTKIAGGFSDQ